MQLLNQWKKKRSSLVLVTKDFGANSLKKTLRKAKLFAVEVLEINETMDDIHTTLGKRCGIISINDIEFSSGIKKLTCDNLRGNIIL